MVIAAIDFPDMCPDKFLVPEVEGCARKIYQFSGRYQLFIYCG